MSNENDKKSSLEQWAIILGAIAAVIVAITGILKLFPDITAPPDPEINSFMADRNETILGDNITLSWIVSHAKTVTLDPGIGSVRHASSMEVSPDETTIYTLTATKKARSTSKQVVVKIVQIPIIRHFNATPETIRISQKSRLSWIVDNDAHIITITFVKGEWDQMDSCLVESRFDSTTYTLEAMNIAGIAKDYATVEREHEDVTIGVMSASTQDLETINSIIENILEPDISAYVDPMGYDVTFDFIIADNQGSAAIALENIQTFKAMGVDLVIFPGWSSSQFQAAMSYVNENDMIMVSSSSTSPLYAIPNDMLFRTCPTDFVQGPAIATMFQTWGIKAVLTMHRADAWGDGLYNVLAPELADRGIAELGHLRYAGEVTEFSSYLAQANAIITEAISIYGKEHVGIQFFSSSELRTIQTQAADYPNLVDIIWMTTGSGGRNQVMLDEAGDLAVQTRHFSAMMAIDEDSDEFRKFDETYYELTENRADLYSTALYDACQLLVEGVLNTSSTEASDIAKVLIPISQEYYGLTGRMSLDENGDRQAQMFDIWGFYVDADGVNNFQKWGVYDGQAVDVTWDDAAVARAGLTRPGP